MVMLLLVYFGLHWLMTSRFGRVVVAIRENEVRAELLGYDVRLYKTAVFAIGGGIGGLAGALFANWGNFVSPGLFGLAQSATIIIWVRSEEHTSELQSLMRISYAVFCLKKKKKLTHK